MPNIAKEGDPSGFKTFFEEVVRKARQTRTYYHFPFMYVQMIIEANDEGYNKNLHFFCDSNKTNEIGFLDPDRRMSRVVTKQDALKSLSEPEFHPVHPKNNRNEDDFKELDFKEYFQKVQALTRFDSCEDFLDDVFKKVKTDEGLNDLVGFVRNVANENIQESDEYKTCPYCNGKGEYIGFTEIESPCLECGGDGQIIIQ